MGLLLTPYIPGPTPMYSTRQWKTISTFCNIVSSTLFIKFNPPVFRANLSNDLILLVTITQRPQLYSYTDPTQHGPTSYSVHTPSFSQ